MRDRTKIIISAALAIVITGTGSFFVARSVVFSERNKYDKQVTALQKTIDDIGPLVDCYTVSEKAISGQPILQTSLVPIKFPKNSIGEGYVLDPSSIVGKFYKIDITPGTPITSDLVMEDKLDDSDRDVDITPVVWPVGLKAGDYIDLRLQYPKGENYVVLSHKRIIAINGDTVKVHISEREQMFYAAASIDYFINQKSGSNIYLTKYTEPGVQKAASVYYNIPSNIYAIMQADPNISDKVIKDGVSRTLIEAGMKIDSTTGSEISAGISTFNGKVTTARQQYDQLQVQLAQQAAADNASDTTSKGFTTNAGGTGNGTTQSQSSETVVDAASGSSTAPANSSAGTTSASSGTASSPFSTTPGGKTE